MMMDASAFRAMRGVLSSQQLRIDEGGLIACTQDAKVCPDGSSVGRVGPDCNFAPCPQQSIDTNGLLVNGSPSLVVPPGLQIGDYHVPLWGLAIGAVAIWYFFLRGDS